MGEVVIFTGPPGAGKTTAANAFLKDRSRGVYIADNVFYDFLRGRSSSPWTSGAAAQNETVTQAAVAAAVAFAADGYLVALDGTFGPWELDAVVDVIPASVRLHYVMMTADPGVLMARALQADSPLTAQIVGDAHERFSENLDWKGHMVDTTSVTTAQCQAVIDELFAANDLLAKRRADDGKR